MTVLLDVWIERIFPILAVKNTLIQALIPWRVSNIAQAPEICIETHVGFQGAPRAVRFIAA
jgi:hypothetical protein